MSSYKKVSLIKAFYEDTFSKNRLNDFFDNALANNIRIYGLFDNYSRSEKDRDSLIQDILAHPNDVNQRKYLLEAIIPTANPEYFILVSLFFTEVFCEFPNVLQLSIYGHMLNGWCLEQENEEPIPDVAKYLELLARLSKGFRLLEVKAEIDYQD